MRALPGAGPWLLASILHGLELENLRNFTDQEFHKGPHTSEQSVLAGINAGSVDSPAGHSGRTACIMFERCGNGDG